MSVPPDLYRISRWYACRTRARAEKQVDRFLSRWGIEAYLPLVEQLRQWADRRKRVSLPLFPGYVFVRFKLTEVSAVLRAPGMVAVVRNGGHPAPVRDEELESVRILAEGASRAGVLPSLTDFLDIGQEVAVVDGPFQGMRGVLVEVRGRSRVVVQLSAIRQAASVALPRKVLRPVH
ncbi:MAG: UpxY family transcription antiterminator [Gemmatimonadetes bacterium]|nr:UpxY family transcription antiterminator [Gemmatimonadota bacterium]